MKLDEQSPPSRLPALFGIYLAVNAIPDSRLLVDGPDCASYKAHFIQGKHDLNSTLLDCSGNDRVRHTSANVNRIVEDRTPALRRALLELAGQPTCGLVLLTPMPMAVLTGTQYDMVLREVAPAAARPCLEVPALALSSDWLDGYSRALSALAAGLDLPAPAICRDKVAVVGYLFDRNENDHIANVAELERLLAAIGLETTSFWLSGRSSDSLRRVAEAGTIVSFPHGREAARLLATRTGARLVECELPVGIGETIRWLRRVAEATGREEQAAALIDAELTRWIPRVQWVLDKHLLGTRVLFVGDPYLFSAFSAFLSELGCRLAGMVAVAGPHHHALIPPPPEGGPVIYSPVQPVLERFLGELPGGPPDLIIQSDAFGWRGRGRHATLPFGCICSRYHAIQDEPFLGFAGAISLIHRIVNRLAGRLDSHGERG